MEKFEEILNKATARGSNVIPGAAVAVVDRDRNYVYDKIFGYNGVEPDAPALTSDQTYLLASCTKLVTSVAALQVVENGLVGLDEPLEKHLPELHALPILVQKDEKIFETRPRTKSITLRQLLTHTSGAALDIVHPMLTAWRISRGEQPSFEPTQDTVKDYDYPLAFEPGEGYTYSSGLDWAGLLIARLNNTTLEDYFHDHIAKPLGITSWTFYPERHPEIEKKLMVGSTRQADGTLTPGPDRLIPKAVSEGGGGGLHSTVHDFMRFLADLLKDQPVLLKKETADLLFTPQLSGTALQAFEGSSANISLWNLVAGGGIPGVKANHGLGGVIILEDIDTEDFKSPRGTLGWLGMPNSHWRINREKGLALFFTTAVSPFMDPVTQALGRDFETAVWKHLAK